MRVPQCFSVVDEDSAPHYRGQYCTAPHHNTCTRTQALSVCYSSCPLFLYIPSELPCTCVPLRILVYRHHFSNHKSAHTFCDRHPSWSSYTGSSGHCILPWMMPLDKNSTSAKSLKNRRKIINGKLMNTSTSQPAD